MARESEAYRPILESLLAYMDERGGGHLMSQKRVAEYLGVEPRTVAKRFGITKSGITAEALAMRLAKL